MAAQAKSHDPIYNQKWRTFMRILIPGGDGMLGHELLRALSLNHEVKVTLRRELSAYADLRIFNSGNAYPNVDVRNLESIKATFDDFHPQAVINAVGVVKQRPDSADAISSITVNALFPHQLADLCTGHGARLVHMSTDCVFSGNRGSYREEDPPDANDLYGRSKLLGEVQGANDLTLRTSIIGRELSRRTGLLEWFLAQRGSVRGYRRAVFSGFTTTEMARIVERLLVRYPNASGVYHVSSEPITKYELLTMIKHALALQTEITPEDSVRIDRSLDSTRFRAELNYTPPTWQEMIAELAQTTPAVTT